jgi:hypothetical protein
MHLGRMNQEGMAQIDRAGISRRQGLQPICPHSIEHQLRHARLAGGREKSRHIEV